MLSGSCKNALLSAFLCDVLLFKCFCSQILKLKHTAVLLSFFCFYKQCCDVIFYETAFGKSLATAGCSNIQGLIQSLAVAQDR
jgi:hypothetical protein